MQHHAVLCSLLLSVTLRPSLDIPRAPSPITIKENFRQTPGAAQRSAGTSRIRGRVFIVGSTMPARRALIEVTSPDMRNVRTTTTDLEGRYEIANLPPGRYSVSASKDGFLGLSFGQTRPSMPSQALQLGERQSMEGVDLFVFRGGAISGRIVDEFGDPLTSVLVTVLRVQFQQGKPRLIAAGPRAETNDLGEYRIFALPPGAYYVSASLPPPPPPLDSHGVQRLGDTGGLAPVFYPGTNDPNAASRVNVVAGETVPEVNISLVATRLASVSGVAMDRHGALITTGTVNALPRGMAQNGFSRGASLGPDGQFRVTGLAPGEYTLIVSSRVAPPPRGMSSAAMPRPDVAVGIVAVNGDDVDGVRLAPLARVTVSGRVIFDNPLAAATISASAVRVTSEALNPDERMMGLMGAPTTPGEDFRFVLQMPPVLVMPRASVIAGPGSSWAVKAVSVNGADVTDTGIALRPGEEVSGVEIELTEQVPTVSGTVTIGNVPAAGYNVIVFPQDRTRWNLSGPSVFQLTRTDASGRFSMTGLRAGRFYAAAILELDDLGWTDPKLLESAARRATAFTLNYGDQKRLDLRGQSK